MRRAVLTASLVLALVAGIFGMRELTQNRPDPVISGSTTMIDFTVDTHRYQRGDEAAATALWTVCSSTVSGDVTLLPESVGDTWRVRVSPAIGEHGENRLVGCLEDVTLDRVMGDVVSLRSNG